MNIPNLTRSIGDLVNGMEGKSFYTAPANPTYNVRGVPLTDPDLHQLGATMFGEISNNPDTQGAEAKVVANTLLNRVSQYQAQGGKYAGYTAGQALSTPGQYQAYGGPEYKRYLAGSTTPADQPKIQAINSVLTQMKSGNFPDTTGGRVYYMNAPSGKIFLKDGSLFKQPASSDVADAAP